MALNISKVVAIAKVAKTAVDQVKKEQALWKNTNPIITAVAVFFCFAAVACVSWAFIKESMLPLLILLDIGVPVLAVALQQQGKTINSLRCEFAEYNDSVSEFMDIFTKEPYSEDIHNAITKAIAGIEDEENDVTEIFDAIETLEEDEWLGLQQSIEGMGIGDGMDNVDIENAADAIANKTVAEVNSVLNGDTYIIPTSDATDTENEDLSIIV